MFIAVLSHDLRTPISTVMMASQFMLESGDLQEQHCTLTTRIARSAKRMNEMVGDLLDFTRGQLGSGVPITREDIDLATEAAGAVDDFTAAYPASVIRLKTSGDAKGNWDCARIGQILSNLIGNAVQHGSAKSPITVSVTGAAKEVVLAVHNSGLAIPRAELPGVFSPFKRLKSGEAAGGATSSLGLGLYIAERIAAAHGGSIEVKSSDRGGTTFTVRLPR